MNKFVQRIEATTVRTDDASTTVSARTFNARIFIARTFTAWAFFAGSTLVAAPIVAAASSLNGGMSGGGGNVINPTPPDRTMNRHEIRALADYLPSLMPRAAQYLAQKHAVLMQVPTGQAGTDEGLRPLFQTRHDVLRIMRKVPLEIEHHKSCFDGSGHAVDGSVADDDEVCLSALNIAQKVHRAEIDAQALALLIHEYGEKAGLDEMTATSVQALVLKEALTFGL